METIISNDIQAAANHLRKGNVIAIPTETVYGLAANAFNAEAVLEVFRVKNRPSFDPLIVHVKDVTAALSLAEDIPPGTAELMNRFWPGPLTIILRKKSSIPDLVTSGLDTVGIRMPDHPLTLQLLNTLDFPLAAPSANPFGYISPTTAKHVSDQLGGKIPYILDGGPCTVGVESTIVGYKNGKWCIYRYGGVTAEQLRSVAGHVTLPATNTARITAPGMLESHYAPGKPFYFGNIRELAKQHASEGKAGFIFYDKVIPEIPQGSVTAVLTEKGNIGEAARNLFAVMRSFDAGGVDLIIAEPVPDTGIGKAINDRMRRAAARV